MHAGEAFFTASTCAMAPTAGDHCKCPTRCAPMIHHRWVWGVGGTRTMQLKQEAAVQRQGRAQLASACLPRKLSCALRAGMRHCSIQCVPARAAPACEVLLCCACVHVAALSLAEAPQDLLHLPADVRCGGDPPAPRWISGVAHQLCHDIVLQRACP